MSDNNEDLSINYHDLTIEPLQPVDSEIEDELETEETDEKNLSIMEGLLFITGDDGLSADKAA